MHEFFGVLVLFIRIGRHRPAPQEKGNPTLEEIIIEKSGKRIAQSYDAGPLWHLASVANEKRTQGEMELNSKKILLSQLFDVIFELHSTHA